MLERAKQMEELQLIINQLEQKNAELEKEHSKDNHWFNGQMKDMREEINDLKEKNAYLEKEKSVLKTKLDEESFKCGMMEITETKGESWLIKKIIDMSNDISALKDNNEKMFEYLHMKCETLEQENHRLLEFGERIQNLSKDIKEYPDIWNNSDKCKESIDELLTDYDFK